MGKLRHEAGLGEAQGRSGSPRTACTSPTLRAWAQPVITTVAPRQQGQACSEQEADSGEPRQGLAHRVFLTLSGRFPISSSFVWFGGHLSCSFTCWIFLCLFILFILLCLECPFCILAVCGVLFVVEFPHCGWDCTGGLSRFPS